MDDVPLQYAGKAPKKGIHRGLIISAFGLFLSFVVYMLVEPVINPLFRYRLPFLRKQAACLTWTSPPNEVAYEEDEREAQRLSGGQPRGADFTTLFGDGKVRAYYNAPRPLDYFYDMETGVGLADQRFGVLFLHSRRAPNGAVRLVHVYVNALFPLREGVPLPFPSRAGFGIDYSVMQVAGLRQDPKLLKHHTWSDPSFGETTPKPTRIFSGQPDPVDESKFSILFQTPTETKLIQGQLLADDTIHFDITAAPDSMIPKRPTTSETNVASPRN